MKEHERYYLASISNRDFMILIEPVEIISISKSGDGIIVINIDTTKNGYWGEPFRVDACNLYKTPKDAVIGMKFYIDNLQHNLKDFLENRNLEHLFMGQTNVPANKKL